MAHRGCQRMWAFIGNDGFHESLAGETTVGKPCEGVGRMLLTTFPTEQIHERLFPRTYLWCSWPQLYWIGSCLLPQHTSDIPSLKEKSSLLFYFSFSSSIMFPSVCIQPAHIICSKGPMYLPRGDTIRSSCPGSVTWLPGHCDSTQGVGFHNSHVRAPPQMHQATKPESVVQRWGTGHFSDVKISPCGSIYPVPPCIRFPKCTASFFFYYKNRVKL